MFFWGPQKGDPRPGLPDPPENIFFAEKYGKLNSYYVFIEMYLCWCAIKWTGNPPLTERMSATQLDEASQSDRENENENIEKSKWIEAIINEMNDSDWNSYGKRYRNT